MSVVFAIVFVFGEMHNIVKIRNRNFGQRLADSVSILRTFAKVALYGFGFGSESTAFRVYRFEMQRLLTEMQRTVAVLVA